MKKNKLKTIISSALTLASFSSAYAGDMGPKSPSSTQPYFGGEAAYTWRQINAPTLNLLTANTSNQPWGFRISAGILHLYTEKLGLTAEVGGGYYGSTSISTAQTSSRGKIDVDGYDILVGALYRLQYFDIFAKIGFMGENARLDFTRYDLSRVFDGNLIRGESRVRSTNGSFLPEISVGGIYNVQNNLGITLTYMHIFGSTMEYKLLSQANIGSGINRSLNVNFQNPTLNSILLGVRYYIS